jgi:hypothetical protein
MINNNYLKDFMKTLNNNQFDENWLYVLSNISSEIIKDTNSLLMVLDILFQREDIYKEIHAKDSELMQFYLKLYENKDFNNIYQYEFEKLPQDFLIMCYMDLNAHEISKKMKSNIKKNRVKKF